MWPLRFRALLHNRDLLDSLTPISVWWPHLRRGLRSDWTDSVYPYFLRDRCLSYFHDARRFESAVDFASISGLEEAVDLLVEVGIKTVEKQVLSLTESLVRRVQELGAKIVSPLENDARSGIISLRIPGAQPFVQRCLEARIRVALRGSSPRLASLLQH